MLDLFRNAGVVQWPLLLCSVFSLAIILERFWTLGRLSRMEDEAFEALKSAQGVDALNNAQIAATPVARIMHSLLPLRGMSADTIGQAADIALAMQRLRLRRFLGTLATVGSTAPFVGLFGTVLGVMHAFKEMSVRGMGGEGMTMSVGISESLSATALGLLVAVPSIIAYNYFVGRVGVLLLHIQSHVALLSPLLTGERAVGDAQKAKA